MGSDTGVAIGAVVLQKKSVPRVAVIVIFDGLCVIVDGQVPRVVSDDGIGASLLGHRTVALDDGVLGTCPSRRI